MTRTDQILDFGTVLKSAAKYWNVDPDYVFSRYRMCRLVAARQWVFKAHSLSGHASVLIGKLYNYNHTTILNALNCFDYRIERPGHLDEARAFNNAMVNLGIDGRVKTPPFQPNARRILDRKHPSYCRAMNNNPELKRALCQS